MHVAVSAKTEHFRDSIIRLRASIDDVAGLVAECADIADQINQLAGLRNRAQNILNHLVETTRPRDAECQEKQVEWIQRMKQLIEPVAVSDPEIFHFVEPLLRITEAIPTDPGRLSDLCGEVGKACLKQMDELAQAIAAWNKEIDTLYSPFPATEMRVRSFIGEVRETLGRIPVEAREAREVRSEIERLSIWDMVRKTAPLGMKGSLVDLVTVQGRLDELLVLLSDTAGHITGLQPTEVATRVVSPGDGAAPQDCGDRERVRERLAATGHT